MRTYLKNSQPSSSSTRCRASRCTRSEAPSMTRDASLPTNKGDNVMHNSSIRPLSWSCPLRVGPPSASTTCAPRAAESPRPRSQGRHVRRRNRTTSVMASARRTALAGAAVVVSKSGGCHGRPRTARRRSRSPGAATRSPVAPRASARVQSAWRGSPRWRARAGSSRCARSRRQRGSRRQPLGSRGTPHGRPGCRGRPTCRRCG